MIFLSSKMISSKDLMTHMGEITFFRIAEVKGYTYITVSIRLKMEVLILTPVREITLIS